MRGNFVLLRAGELRLVVPQDDVGVATYIESANEGESISLSHSMKLLPARPAERFVAAEFSGDYAGTAWCWDELRVMIDAQFDPIEVPKALMSEDSPVQAYVEVDGHLAFLTSAANICRYALAEQA
jgi:hypothetical protein